VIATDIDKAIEYTSRWRGRVVRGDTANIQSPEFLHSRHSLTEFRE
jgi:hypothetical protein